MKKIAALLLAFLLSFPSGLGAKRYASGGSHSSHTSHSRARSHTKSHSSRTYTSAHHSTHGRTKRSAAAKHQFMTQTGYPHGRKGYVVDHKIPLACGGADDPSNMQWQTKADAKAKDKWERKGCK